jgi:hypothetical protein
MARHHEWKSDFTGGLQREVARHQILPAWESEFCKGLHGTRRNFEGGGTAADLVRPGSRTSVTDGTAPGMEVGLTGELLREGARQQILSELKVGLL